MEPFPLNFAIFQNISFFTNGAGKLKVAESNQAKSIFNKPWLVTGEAWLATGETNCSPVV